MSSVILRSYGSLYLSSLDQSRQHDNDTTSSLVHHLPEVPARLLKRCLGNDEGILLMVAAGKSGMDVVWSLILQHNPPLVSCITNTRVTQCVEYCKLIHMHVVTIASVYKYVSCIYLGGSQCFCSCENAALLSCRPCVQDEVTFPLVWQTGPLGHCDLTGDPVLIVLVVWLPVDTPLYECYCMLVPPTLPRGQRYTAPVSRAVHIKVYWQATFSMLWINCCIFTEDGSCIATENQRFSQCCSSIMDSPSHTGLLHTYGWMSRSDTKLGLLLVFAPSSFSGYVAW